ncbi:glycerol kinase, partial [Klebsiella oxytoca]
MAIDQGTTSTRAIIFDQEGDPKWSNQKDIEQYYPEPSWVEQDANEIWLKTLQVVSSVLI